MILPCLGGLGGVQDQSWRWPSSGRSVSEPQELPSELGDFRLVLRGLTLRTIMKATLDPQFTYIMVKYIYFSVFLFQDANFIELCFFCCLGFIELKDTIKFGRCFQRLERYRIR